MAPPPPERLKGGNMETVVVEFKTEWTPKGAREMVLLAPAGEAYERTKTWFNVDRIRPPAEVDDSMRENPSFNYMLHRWEHIVKPAYDAWKAGQELPEHGTPLAAWPGVTKEQVEFLRKMAIKSVEDLAAINEATIAKLPFPNARKLPETAKSFLDGRDKAAVETDLASANERIAAMEAMLEEMTASKPKPKGKAA